MSRKAELGKRSSKYDPEDQVPEEHSRLSVAQNSAPCVVNCTYRQIRAYGYNLAVACHQLAGPAVMIG